MVGFQCHSTFLKVYIFGIVASQQISNKQNIFYFFFSGGPRLGHSCYGAWPFISLDVRNHCHIRKSPHFVRVALHLRHDVANRRRILKNCTARGENIWRGQASGLRSGSAQAGMDTRSFWRSSNAPMRDSTWTFILQCIFISTQHSCSQRPFKKRDNFRQKLDLAQPQKMLKCSGFWGLMIRL